jgi:hypothetical protein
VTVGILAPGAFVGPGLAAFEGRSAVAPAQLLYAHKLPFSETLVKVVVVAVDV